MTAGVRVTQVERATARDVGYARTMFVRSRAWALAVALLAALGAGCGSEDDAALLPVGEVRGAPIVAKAERAQEPDDASQAEAVAAAQEPRPEPTVAPAQEPAQNAPEPQEPEPAADDDEYSVTDWELLSGFDYAMLEPTTLLAVDDGKPLPDLEDRFPTEVVELDGRRVLIEGYMIPYEYDDRGIYSFTLVRDQAQCCFGASPQMNHWISVEMADDGRAEPADLDPIYVKGRFEVGEQVEDGYVTSIYRIVADEVDFGF